MARTKTCRSWAKASLIFISPFPYAVHCTNNAVHVYCVVYTVTPVPPPAPRARHGLFFYAAC